GVTDRSQALRVALAESGARERAAAKLGAPCLRLAAWFGEEQVCRTRNVEAKAEGEQGAREGCAQRRLPAGADSFPAASTAGGGHTQPLWGGQGPAAKLSACSRPGPPQASPRAPAGCREAGSCVAEALGGVEHARKRSPRPRAASPPPPCCKAATVRRGQAARLEPDFEAEPDTNRASEPESSARWKDGAAPPRVETATVSGFRGWAGARLAREFAVGARARPFGARRRAVVTEQGEARSSPPRDVSGSRTLSGGPRRAQPDRPSDPRALRSFAVVGELQAPGRSRRSGLGARPCRSIPAAGFRSRQGNKM
ncbi:hypothetical protein MC885_011933, partial [Smutsia gigantea]